MVLLIRVIDGWKCFTCSLDTIFPVSVLLTRGSQQTHSTSSVSHALASACSVTTHELVLHWGVSYVSAV